MAIVSGRNDPITQGLFNRIQIYKHITQNLDASNKNWEWHFLPAGCIWCQKFSCMFSLQAMLVLCFSWSCQHPIPPPPWQTPLRYFFRFEVIFAYTRYIRSLKLCTVKLQDAMILLLYWNKWKLCLSPHQVKVIGTFQTRSTCQIVSIFLWMRISCLFTCDISAVVENKCKTLQLHNKLFE